MHRLAFAAVAALLLAAPSSADTFSDCFDPVSVEVDSRIALLPATPSTKEEKAELKALLSVRKTLDREYRTLNVAVDVKNASKIVRTLLKAYPADGEIATLLGDLVACLETLCLEEHGALQTLIAELPESPKRIGLENGHNTLDEKLGALAALGTADKAKALIPVSRGLVALRKKFLKVVSGYAGKAGVTSVINGKTVVAGDVEGSIALGAGEGEVSTISITAITVIPVIVETRTVTIVIAGLVGGNLVEPGTYDLTGLPVTLTYSTLGGPNPPLLLNATAGTLTLVQVDLATGTASGVFDCTGMDGENPFTLKVKFNLTGLPVVAP